MELKQLREAAELIARAAIEAVDPRALTQDCLELDGNLLTIGDDSVDLEAFRSIVVVGAGKAAAHMAGAIEQTLGDRISGGLVIVKDGHGLPLERIKFVEAGHPIPDARGEMAARKIITLLESNAAADTLVLCLLSGGGSALMPLPQAPVTLEAKREITNILLRCGATIDEINAIRKHISGIKGGRLARAAFPSRLFSLILSDVVGDPLHIIASGPTVGDPSTYSDCASIFRHYDIWSETPDVVRELIERGRAGKIPETPGQGDPIFDSVSNIIIGNNIHALRAALSKASSLGFNARILSDSITGEAREVGAMLASLVLEEGRASSPAEKPICILAGGETTVTILGGGKGGRNQELALAAAIALSGKAVATLASIGTDGTDGPTDAAGAIVDSTTVDRARAIGLDPQAYLDDNDSYNLLKPVGDLLITGPTGTNVMDIMIALSP
jgi:hydroxypyruvate reductase